MASTFPSFSAGARPNCDQIFSILTSSYFTPARRSTILKYSSDVWPLARPIVLPRTSPILPTSMPLPFLVTMASGVSQRSSVASFMMSPMTWNGLPACTAFRYVVVLISPTCASPLCKALTMSVPVSTTLKLASTPCSLKKPFSAPMNIGRWPKLLAITTSSLGKSAMAVLPIFVVTRLRASQHLRIDAIRRHAAVDQRLNIIDHDIRHFLAHFHHRAAEMWRKHNILQLV